MRLCLLCKYVLNAFWVLVWGDTKMSQDPCFKMFKSGAQWKEHWLRVRHRFKFCSFSLQE